MHTSMLLDSKTSDLLPTRIIGFR